MEWIIGGSLFFLFSLAFIFFNKARKISEVKKNKNANESYRIKPSIWFFIKSFFKEFFNSRRSNTDSFRKITWSGWWKEMSRRSKLRKSGRRDLKKHLSE